MQTLCVRNFSECFAYINSLRYSHHFHFTTRKLRHRKLSNWLQATLLVTESMQTGSRVHTWKLHAMLPLQISMKHPTEPFILWACPSKAWDGGSVQSCVDNSMRGNVFKSECLGWSLSKAVSTSKGGTHKHNAVIGML